jgi:hypothetical protein
MNFTNKELDFLFYESNSVLKANGLLYFSVRSDDDELFDSRYKMDKNEDIYEINGFQIRFFSKEQIESLLSSFNFKIDKILSSIEEPACLYLVFSHKDNTN